MTIFTDIAADYAVFDGVETVSLTPKNPSGTLVTGVKALRLHLTRAQLNSGATLGIEPTDVPFHLWFAPCSVPATVPKNDDILTDAAGDSWTILSVVYIAEIKDAQVVCRKRV